MNSPASCPGCSWTIVAVIGRVDCVSLTDRFVFDAKAMQYKSGVELAGPLCRCARCGVEFYVSGGKVHEWQAGARDVREPNPTHTHANGTRTHREVIELAKVLATQRAATLDGLAPDDDAT